jgi:hypothetical protein
MKTDNRELWVKRVERWRDSGLSAKEFAAEIGVNAWTLAHWKWRLGAERRGKLRPGSKKPCPPTAPAFVEVAPVAVAEALTAPPPRRKAAAARPPQEREAPAEHEPLEVLLLNGLCIRVPVHFEAASLGRVVAALQGR